MTPPRHRKHGSSRALRRHGDSHEVRAGAPGLAVPATGRRTALALSFAVLASPVPQAWGADGPPPDVSVEDARVVLLPRRRGRWAGYMTLRNKGHSPARLVGANTPLAARVQIHETATESPVAPDRRRRSIIVPPGGAELFTPGGLYLAFSNPVKRLCGGDRFHVTLRFPGGNVTSIFFVDAIGGSPLGEGPVVVPEGVSRR
jgi:periplasmic copper chaperone A